MSINTLESPITNRRFIWFAKYYDDSMLTEFDDAGNENKFNDIDKENLKEFGFLGCRAKLWFNTDDGIIRIKAHEKKETSIEYYLEDENQKIIRLSNIGEKFNDIIQLKRLFIDVRPNGSQSEGVNQYVFGYKTAINVEGRGKLYYKILFKLSLDGTPSTIETRYAPTFDLNAKQFVRLNGNTSDPVDLYIKDGKSKTLIQKVL